MYIFRRRREQGIIIQFKGIVYKLYLLRDVVCGVIIPLGDDPGDYFSQFFDLD
jgi:hypothetical protein